MSRCSVPTRLTTTSYALLGLLRLRSWTTYELAKQVQRGLGWFWPRAERKLYEEPKRLVDAGFATATEEHTGKDTCRFGQTFAIGFHTLGLMQSACQRRTLRL